jgi:hypothetical protein
VQESARSLAIELVNGTAPHESRLQGVNYDLLGTCIDISDDDAGVDPILGEAMEEEAPAHDSCTEPDTEDDGIGALPPPTAPFKRPAAVAVPEPPTVASLLEAAKRSKHFDLQAAVGASASSAAAVGRGSAAAASSSGAAPATSLAGAAAPTTRGGKSLVDPAEWNERHADVLKTMPGIDASECSARSPFYSLHMCGQRFGCAGGAETLARKLEDHIWIQCLISVWGELTRNLEDHFWIQGLNSVLGCTTFRDLCLVFESGHTWGRPNDVRRTLIHCECTRRTSRCSC